MEVNSSEEITEEDLGVFKDALTGPYCDNLELKLCTIRRIATLAKVLGPERTREELIDLLTSLIENFEDEVLMALVEELELFLPLVGGPTFSYELLSMLLKISRSVDEPIVRDKTIETIKKILADIDEQLTEKYFISTIVEIDDNHWFPEKCSTLSLIPVCYSKASPENKIILRQKFALMFNDGSEVIRKMAGEALPDFLDNLEIEAVLNEFIPILQQILKDDQEVVQIVGAEVSMAIAKKSKNQDVRNDMLEAINGLRKHSSWRIRQRVASLFDRIAQIFDDKEFLQTLISIYANLIDDQQIEVRISAVHNLYNFAKDLRKNSANWLTSEESFDAIFLDNFVPILLTIDADDSEEVQLVFSSNIMFLATIVSINCFKIAILPIVIEGLEQDKPLLYKENILMNIDLLPEGVDLIKSLSSINEMIEHILRNSVTSWRTRRSLLVTFVRVSEFCSEEYFNDNMLGYYNDLLKDKVYAVRRTASSILPLLVKRFGAKWFIKELISQFNMFLEHTKYLFRFMVPFSIQELVSPSFNNIIENCEMKYLNDFKKLIQLESFNYGNTLCKISRLNGMLKNTLRTEPFETIIDKYTDDYNIKGENVRMYSEQVMDTIMKKNINIFSVGEPEENNTCYLGSVLILLNKVLLNSLKILIDDPTENIQERSKYVLTLLNEFSNDIDKELKSDWVVNHLAKITDTQWQEIDIQITEELENYEKVSTDIKSADEQLILTDTVKTEPHSITMSEAVKTESVEIFPSDCLKLEEKRVEQMESLDEERPKDLES